MITGGPQPEIGVRSGGHAPAHWAASLRVCLISDQPEVWARSWWATHVAGAWPEHEPIVRWESLEGVATCTGTLARVRRDDVVCVIAGGAGPEAELALRRACLVLGEHAAAGACCLDQATGHLAGVARAAGLLPHISPGVHDDEVSRGVSGAMLAGLLLGAGQRQHHVRDVEAELDARRAAQSHVNTFVSKVDGELLLAAKLQREVMRTDDFHPPNLDYAVIFRPAWFVSGDVYKLTRLDEDHVGLLIADAMGHGVSAAMYSMLIANSASMKDFGPGGYRLVPPSEAMERLNASLMQPDSESTRFASAIAATLNLHSGALSLCNAGHPTALVVGETVRRLESTGPVLGVVEEPGFELASARVAPGETVVMYTDGLEASLGTHGGAAACEAEIEAFVVAQVRAAGGDPHKAASLIEHALDTRPGSLAPQDDLTIVLVTRRA